MDRERTRLLFRALGAILDGQIVLMRHLGITKYDYEYGWEDSPREEIARECNEIGYEQN